MHFKWHTNDASGSVGSKASNLSYFQSEGFNIVIFLLIEVDVKWWNIGGSGHVRLSMFVLMKRKDATAHDSLN